MSGSIGHVVFDVVAWLAAAAAAFWLSRIEGISFSAAVRTPAYLAAAIGGALAGAYLFGTANLWLSGRSGIARSIEGAMFGAIVVVELYKRAVHLRIRTGARFALPLAVGIAIGRIGCHVAGLEDFTYGVPTALPWGHDFGDGVPRHPVALYESAAMAAFAAFYVRAVRRRDCFVISQGFYLVVGWYGLQRFFWEFIKPYGPLLRPFTLFHLLSAAIVVYAVVMIATAAPSRAANDRAFA
jgi:phosphatidylglycerol:prolipoprotein diacylglycerol transferase